MNHNRFRQREEEEAPWVKEHYGEHVGQRVLLSLDGNPAGHSSYTQGNVTEGEGKMMMPGPGCRHVQTGG